MVNKIEVSETPFKNTYKAGSYCDTIYIAVASKETGIDQTYTWYYNETNSNSGGMELTTQPPTSYTNKGVEYTGFKLNKAFEAGEYYLYCVIRNTDQADAANYSEVASGTCKVIFEALDLSDFDGDGTQESPFLLKTVDDLLTLQKRVNEEGVPYTNVYFRMVADITLPKNWTPIGCTKDGNTDIKKGANLNAFSGTIDGENHLLTVPAEGLPLLGYVRDATVKNLNIKGERIAGAGLVNNYTGPDLHGNAITIENVCLKNGTKTLKSGLVQGVFGGNQYSSATADFTVTIRNCTAEDGVVIGYTGTESRIGTFANKINGTIENCTSYATVKGKNYVGGLIGTMDNAMGKCTVRNSSFHGTVSGSNYVGGIIGGAYSNDNSAPNGGRPNLIGNTVDGTVTGGNCVGGITGGDQYVAQTRANVAHSVTGNIFKGIISGSQYVGGIIGYYNSLNVYDNVAGNKYSGADKGVGYVKYIDTSYKNPKLMDGTVAFNTGETTVGLPDVQWNTWKEGLNREDDPLGVDAENLARKIGGSSQPTCIELTVSGSYKTEYDFGENLDLTGIILTASWDDGTTSTMSLDDVKISGYDKNTVGNQTISLSYGAAVAYITVTVKPVSTKITVSVTILGDTKHGNTKTPHGLARGGLTTWASESNVEADTAETVWDVLQRVAKKHNITITASDNNAYHTVYISAVNGLGEFDNGKHSGWMYTVNGTHPEKGVSARYVKNGDTIILHYTDDYTLEAADMGPAPEEKKTADEVIALINAIGVVDLTKGDVIAKARAAYDALSAADKKLVTNYQTLLDAEAAYAKLVAELGKKADSVYKTTGDYLAKLGTPGVGSIGGEWMALGLARSGRTVPEGYYDAVVKYVKDNIDSNGRLDKNKATENARIILALTAIGKDVTNVDGHDLLAGLNEMSYLSKQGINGAIFTLIALDSHSYTPAGDVTRDKLVQVILDAQISSDGGWSLDGKNADVDMTAMAIQALAAYYKSNSSAKKAVDKGLSWLSSVQQNDGGFTSWGAANSESCAQVIVALTALGIDPAKDSRFIKNGVSVLDALCSFAVNGGGFKHLATETSANGMATEQGFYALVAYYRLLNGQTSLYDMTDVKLEGVKAEEPVDDTDKSDDTADTDTPVDTEVGEASSGGQVVLWVVIGVVAVGGIAALAVTSKKRHGRDAE